EQPSPALGNAKIVSVQDYGIRRISQIAQRIAEPRKNRAVVPDRQIGHILEKHSAGTKTGNDCDEALPQVGARIMLRATTGDDQALDLGFPRVRERLTWNPAGDQ